MAFSWPEISFAQSPKSTRERDYKPGDPPFTNMLLLIMTRGVPSALEYYDKQKKEVTSGPDKIDESTLNSLGYITMTTGDVKSAVTLFERNVKEYPNSSNVYDSLAECQAEAGDKASAIKNYERSLQMNPDNKHAIDELKMKRECLPLAVRTSGG